MSLFAGPSFFSPLIIPPAAYISHLLLASFCSSMPSTLDQEAQLSSPGGCNAVVAMATWCHRGVVIKYRRLLWISVANVHFFSPFICLDRVTPHAHPNPQLSTLFLDLVCHTFSFGFVSLASFLKDLSPWSSRPAVRAPLSIDSDANVRQCLDEESLSPSNIGCVTLITMDAIVLVTPVWINRVCLIETVGCDNGTGRSPDSMLWWLWGGLYVNDCMILPYVNERNGNPADILFSCWPIWT